MMTEQTFYKTLIFGDTNNPAEIDDDTYYAYKNANTLAMFLAQKSADKTLYKAAFKFFLLTTFAFVLAKKNANANLDEIENLAKNGDFGDANGVEKRYFLEAFAETKEDIAKLLNLLCTFSFESEEVANFYKKRKIDYAKAERIYKALRVQK